MIRPPSRLSRVTTAPTSAFAPSRGFSSRGEFYREEFLKHQWCLEQQREYYSEPAMLSAECALAGIIARLDELCGQDGGDELIAALLRKFDVVTGLSAWDPLQVQH